MKVPKRTRKYCKFCKKHTEQKVMNAKRRSPNSARPQSVGSKVRCRKRGLRRGAGNHGRFSRPPINKRKMSGKKTSKKTDFRYQCTACKKATTQRKGKRAKRVELK